MVPLAWYLAVSALLFGAGLYTVLARRSVVGVLMGVELMLNAANVNLVAFARYVGPAATAQAFALFVIAVAAAEAAVGLGLIVAAYRQRGTVNAEDLRTLRG